MKNSVRKLAGILAFSMALAIGGTAPATVQAANSESTVQPSVWETQIFNNSDEIYLSTQTDGMVLTMDGNLVSKDAHIKMVVSEDGVYFRLFDRDGTDLYSSKEQQGEFIYALSATRIPEAFGKVYNAGDDIRWFVTGVPKCDQDVPLTSDKLLINELNMNGIIDLWFKMPSWNGEAERVLYFTISSADDDFALQFVHAMDNGWKELSASGNDSTNSAVSDTAADNTAQAAAADNTAQAAPAQSSYYSNEEIMTICDNYVYRFNDVVPYANSLYEDIRYMDEHPIWGVLNGALTIGTAMEPLENFIEAKGAFDRLDTSEMTPDQRNYYYSTQNNVNQTELGTIISVIEFFNDMGLLE